MFLVVIFYDFEFVGYCLMVCIVLVDFLYDENDDIFKYLYQMRKKLESFYR